jgi:hypothetical protein
MMILAAPLLALLAPGQPVIESSQPWQAKGRLDEIVSARWRQLKVEPARLASDAVFVRRAFLDLNGTLPTAAEVTAFLSSRDPHKRAALVDELLARPQFAAHAANKWSDLLRIKAEFPINLWPHAAQGYYHWVRAALERNQPYDAFARELLTASGSNFRDPASNFYRAVQSHTPEAIAQAVALTFLGARAEKWPQPRLQEMAAFFARVDYKPTGEWKEEIVYFNPAKAGPLPQRFPDGSAVRITGGEDPRRAFALWLTTQRNPWFARAAVNRIWSWLLGRGLVEEADDLRDDNPAWSPELLEYLEQELIASRYDLRHIYRLIAKSATYQLSSLPGLGADASRQFAAYPLRRLDAEVLIDALCQITGASETYTSAIPEPYTFMPDYQRAGELPDGSISSPFLELFGRPARDTGLEAERNNRITSAQRLHMLNSTQIQRMVQGGPKLVELMRGKQAPRETVDQLYLAILSRHPAPEEWKAIAAHGQGRGVRGREAFTDLVWALINSPEFLYRH